MEEGGPWERANAGNNELRNGSSELVNGSSEEKDQRGSRPTEQVAEQREGGIDGAKAWEGPRTRPDMTGQDRTPRPDKGTTPVASILPWFLLSSLLCFLGIKIFF